MTLEFLEIMTLRPRAMAPEHINAVLDSGISIETLIDAIEVGVVLKLVSRYASALDFAVPTHDRVSPGNSPPSRSRRLRIRRRDSPSDAGCPASAGHSAEWSCQD